MTALQFSALLVCAIVLSLALDVFALPRTSLRRSGEAVMLHAATVLFLICIAFLATKRPFFSTIVAVGIVGLTVAVSNAKYESLREPFVFSDLSLFSQLFSHPRLYLPFLSVGKVLLIAIGVLLLGAGHWIEMPLASAYGLATGFAAVACMILGRWLAGRMVLTLVPEVDQRNLGFFSVFVAYLLNGMRLQTLRSFRRVVAAGPYSGGEPLVAHPDVIMIQSESFFDVRQISPAIMPTVLTNYDRVREESVYHGELEVPAWGANTMRTEFSVLTGIPSAKLGYARFYPYAFVRRKCASLASWFERNDYDTIGMHPYYGSFFGRKRVFPLMGFGRLIDIADFDSAPLAGPYISDAAVVEKIISVLDAPRSSPLFIFAMTMENHGPLHLESVELGESRRYHELGEGKEWRDLTAYLRHVANADAMLGRLIEFLRARQRETIVCFYGDHVPALPRVFDRIGATPERSHYLIWRNSGTKGASRQDVRAESLGAMVFGAMQPDEFSATTLSMTTRQ
ncbi:LTA synthase family protein [Burkholderia cenocepacia]|uniref:LTA synthase family protein n=1 Tax=Burkholderia cenocepacia TaxID=95486 RepID=UPI0032C2349B